MKIQDQSFMLSLFPFTSQAAEVVRGLGYSIDDLLEKPFFQPIRDRAYERVMGVIADKIPSNDPGTEIEALIELLSYPLARIMVSCIGDLLLIKKYAIGEARLARSRLEREDIDTITLIANDLGFYPTRDGNFLKLHFIEYVRAAHRMRSPKWKLVNRDLREGYLTVDQSELTRLMEEIIRDRVLKGLPLKTPEGSCGKLDHYIQRISGSLKRQGDGGITGSENTSEGAFPPCISRLLSQIRAGTNLAHSSRFAISSFLLNIGMDVDGVLSIFNTSPDFNEEKTRYQLEHISGRGTNKRYDAPACAKMMTYGNCPGGNDLCKEISHPLRYRELELKGQRWVLETCRAFNRAEQDKAEQDKAEQDTAEQDKAILDKENQGKVEQGNAEQDKAEQGKAILDKENQDEVEQDKAILDKENQGKVEQDKAEQNKAEQNKAEQGKAILDKENQDKVEQDEVLELLARSYKSCFLAMKRLGSHGIGVRDEVNAQMSLKMAYDGRGGFDEVVSSLIAAYGSVYLALAKAVELGIDPLVKANLGKNDLSVVLEAAFRYMRSDGSEPEARARGWLDLAYRGCKERRMAVESSLIDTHGSIYVSLVKAAMDGIDPLKCAEIDDEDALTVLSAAIKNIRDRKIDKSRAEARAKGWLMSLYKDDEERLRQVESILIREHSSLYVALVAASMSEMGRFGAGGLGEGDARLISELASRKIGSTRPLRKDQGRLNTAA